MANYGIPYQGSKDKLVHQITSLFPSAEHFYDLFGGGFSVTHYMILHHRSKYKHFYFNEIAKGNGDLIKEAIAGKYNYNVFKPKWIDRETFLSDKDTCPYTRILWSFGNNQKSYMFGKEIEGDKKSLHNAVVFGEFDDNSMKLLCIKKWPEHLSIRGRRLLCRNIMIKKLGGQLKQLQHLERLERLQHLEQLERLQQLENLGALEITSLSYEQVKIKPNSIIYCDPPYKNTTGYLKEFDHDRFWQWVKKQSQPVFVSEYDAPKDIKTLMALRNKKAKEKNVSVEKLFGNEAAVEVLFSNHTLKKLKGEK